MCHSRESRPFERDSRDTSIPYALAFSYAEA